MEIIKLLTKVTFQYNTSAFKFLCRDKEFQYYANMLFCIHKSVCTETNIRYFVPTHPSKEQSLLSKLHSVKGVWAHGSNSFLLAANIVLLFKDITYSGLMNF